MPILTHERARASKKARPGAPSAYRVGLAPSAPMPIMPSMTRTLPHRRRAARLAATGAAVTIVAGCGGTGLERQTLNDATALGPYSAAVLAGDYVFLSGKIGERGGAFALEAQTALDAVERDLRRSGLTMSDIVSVQVFVTDMAWYAEFNEIYAERVPAPYPARAVVEVSALPGGARVEIMVTAMR